MQRLTRMDGLRGVLAVYVMLGHAFPFTTLPTWATGPFHHGEAAVDLFFALSGLVILNSLERFSGAFRPFILARAKRLLPVYFLVLGAAVLLLATLNPMPQMPWVSAAGRLFWQTQLPPAFPWHLAAHVLLIQGILPQSVLPFTYVTLLGPAWSLSTEWQFYILIGLVAPRRLTFFTLALLATGAAYHLVWPPAASQFSRSFLPDAAPYFALGLASAEWLRSGRPWLFLVCLTASCLVEALSGSGKALVPLAWGVAILAQFMPWGVVLEHRWVQYLGAISYPLYLVNEPAQRLAACMIAPCVRGSGALFTLFWLPFSLALCLAAASALHHGVELPFMRQRKKILLPVIAAPTPQ